MNFVSTVRAPVRFFLTNLAVLFILIIQDTHVSDSFSSDQPWFFYIATFLMSSSLSLFSWILNGPGDITEESDSDNFYCNQCQQYVPARALHCEKCGMCVQRRLHHSDIADLCIGLQNHISYFYFICFELLVLVLLFVELFLSITRDYDGGINYFLLHRGILVLMMPLTLYYALQCIILIIQHIYIIMFDANVLKEKRFLGLKYLVIQRNSRNIFGMGILNNIAFAFAPPVGRKWIVYEDARNFDTYCADIKEYYDIEYRKEKV